MQSQPGADLDYWLDGGQVLRKTMRRADITSDCAALTTQVMKSVAIYLELGDLVTYLTFKSGGTAAGTPTNWWFALFDTAATPALIAQSADQTTTAWAGDTTKTLALSTPYRVAATGIYYAACMVKATTVPTLAGRTLDDATDSAAVLTGQKVLAQSSGSALTTTAPATIASGTALATVPFAMAS